MVVTIERLGIEDAGGALEMVQRLLTELGEEGDELGTLDAPKVFEAWTRSRDAVHTFLARDSGGRPVGIMTVVESFAIYANGNYGIINERQMCPVVCHGAYCAEPLERVPRGSRPLGRTPIKRSVGKGRSEPLLLRRAWEGGNAERVPPPS